MVEIGSVLALFLLGSAAGIIVREACCYVRSEREAGIARHRWRCDGCGKMHRWRWPEGELRTEMKTWLDCDRCDRQTLAVWQGDHWRKIESRDRRAAFQVLKGPGA